MTFPPGDDGQPGGTNHVPLTLSPSIVHHPADVKGEKIPCATYAK
jgi:hypothetical protein